MTEHYCKVHGTKFYRNEKDGRSWYSHKIKGGSGYCNEPKEDASPDTGNEPDEVKTEPISEIIENMSKGDWAEKDRLTRKSIERQKSLELAINLVIANKIPLTEASMWTRKFESYLEKGGDSKLIEEVKKLSNTGIPY